MVEYTTAGPTKYDCMKPPVSDRINDVLGLSDFEKSVNEMTPTPEEEVTDEIAPVCVPSGSPEVDADVDLQHARQNLRTILEKAQDALDANIDFARQSDNPKAYEALAQILQAAVSASTALMGVNKTRSEIAKKQQAAAGNPTVNNNTLMVTTSDLLKMIRENADVIDAEVEDVT